MQLSRLEQKRLGLEEGGAELGASGAVAMQDRSVLSDPARWPGPQPLPGAEPHYSTILVNDALTLRGQEETLDQTLLNDSLNAVAQQLQQLAGDPTGFGSLLQSLYGAQLNREASEALRQSLVAGDFRWRPAVVLVGRSDLGGVDCRFDADANTVRLSRELLRSSPEQAQQALMVSLPEVLRNRLTAPARSPAASPSTSPAPGATGPRPEVTAPAPAPSLPLSAEAGAQLHDALNAVAATLTALAQDAHGFQVTLQQLYGSQLNVKEGEAFRLRLVAGDFAWRPEVVLAGAADLSGAEARYDAASRTVRLSHDVLSRGSQPAQQALLAVLPDVMRGALTAPAANGGQTTTQGTTQGTTNTATTQTTTQIAVSSNSTHSTTSATGATSATGTTVKVGPVSPPDRDIGLPPTQLLVDPAHARIALAHGAVINPVWLQQRDVVLDAVGTFIDQSLQFAINQGPGGLGWRVFEPHWPETESGRAATPIGPQGQVLRWVPTPGVGAPADQAALEASPGQWWGFCQDTFTQHLQADMAANPPLALQQLGTLYGVAPDQVFRQHPQLWSLAQKSDRSMHAGPPPVPGLAMGELTQLGLLDLHLRDPLNQQLIHAFGGSVAEPTSALALEQVRLYGRERWQQLSKLDRALATVRDTFNADMAKARTGHGPGWVEVPMQTGFDSETGQPTGVFQVDPEGIALRGSDGQPLLATTKVFSPEVFAEHWLAQGGPLQQGFLATYGQVTSTLVAVRQTGESGDSIAFWDMESTTDLAGWSITAGQTALRNDQLAHLDLQEPPRLNHDEAVWFDFSNGWSTPYDNLYKVKDLGDRLGEIAPLAAMVAVAWFSAGTLGPQAAAGMGLTTSTTVAGVTTTTLTAAGVMVAAGFAGGATALANAAFTGDLKFENILKSVFSGALTAGFMQGLGEVFGAVREVGSLAHVAARATVGGAVELLMGGSLEEGFRAGFASGLSAALTQQFDAHIADLGGTERMAAIFASRLVTSAVSALASRDDPGYAFAQAFLDGLMQRLPQPSALDVPSGFTVFDESGNLLPGVVDPNLPPSLQYAQLAQALIAQGMGADEAYSVAFDHLLKSGADMRTVRGYFVPDEHHDLALAQVRADWSGLGELVDDGASTDDPAAVEANAGDADGGSTTVTVSARRITFSDELAGRIGGPLADLYAQGKALGLQGLQLASDGLSLLDVPALQEYQGRVRDYLSQKAEAGGLSEAEIILFGSLYAANEALMPTNAVDFAGGIGKAIGGAAAILKAGGKVDDVVDAVRLESQAIAKAIEDRVAEAGELAKSRGLELFVERAGSKGNWNSNLNGPLQPNSLYLLSNGHLYETDAAGRVVFAQGKLNLDTVDRNAYQQLRAGQAGGPGYDGGHLFAVRFGGAGEGINYVAQLSSVNRGEYRVMEKLWADSIAAGKEVTVEIRPVYPGGSNVPSGINVTYWIDGQRTTQPFVN